MSYPDSPAAFHVWIPIPSTFLDSLVWIYFADYLNLRKGKYPFSAHFIMKNIEVILQFFLLDVNKSAYFSANTSSLLPYMT